MNRRLTEPTRTDTRFPYTTLFRSGMVRYMKRKALITGFLATALALPAGAAAPPFDTPAPVAFITDLSSGAILYAKDADRRLPPASTAKMMTAHVAFNLMKKGDLKSGKMCGVRREKGRASG